MADRHATHWLEREDRGDVTIVRFRAKKLMDDDDTRAVFDQIYSLVEDMGRKNLLLDLAVLEYISSLGLGKLVMLNRKVQAAEGWLALCRLTPTASEILEVTHLINLFFIYMSEEEALQAFAMGR